MLLQGVDEISLTLARSDEIEAFRARDMQRRPWAYCA
jgi:3-isopropylmalate dehydratase small subunit